MVSQLVTVSSLLIGSALLLMAGALHALLLPTQGVLAGFSTTELGLIGTGYAVGFMAGCLVLPKLVARIGHVRAFGAMTAIASVTILLNLLVVWAPFWIGLRAVTGFCFAGTTMIVESWLNERVTSDFRGRFFSIYQVVNNGASTAGQLLLVITFPSSYVYFALGAILYSLALLPTALSSATVPSPLKTARIDVAGLYLTSPVAAVGCFLIGLLNGAFGTLGPVYAQRIGLPIPSVATMAAGAMVGGALLQVPVGRLSDRFDRRQVLAGVSVAATVISLAIFLIRPHDPWVVIALAVGFGAVTYPMYALAVAHANDFAGPGEFVRTSSTLLLLYGVGTMVAPPLAAVGMDQIAPEGLFAFTALVDVAMIAYVLYRIRVRSPQPHRDRFNAIPPSRSVTPESAVLDPRATEEATPVEPSANRDA